MRILRSARAAFEFAWPSVFSGGGNAAANPHGEWPRKREKRFSCVLVPLICLLCGEPLLAQIGPTPIPGISVEIADFIDFPDTRNLGAQEQNEDSRVSENVARINFLRALPDATNRWFVNDLRGDLYMVNSVAKTSQTYLNFRSEFSRFRYGTAGLSTGLVGVTPHPQFATNGKFYTVHTEINTGSPAADFVALGNPGNLTGNNAMHSVITEWTATNPAANVFSGTRREIMRTAAPQGFLHGQGDLAFNPLVGSGDPDYGMLYIAGGDFGYDAYGRGTAQAQNLASIYGKILRIDPAGNNSANGKYGIPASNPYALDGNPGTAGEIFATGFRNAHRIMWDSVSGKMFTTDIGQNNIEEIDIVRPGLNYGWSQREGTFLNGGGTIGGNPNTDGFTYPVAQYDHGDGNAIAGGFAYRGTQIPALYGKFVYGDIVRGRIFYSDINEMIAADDGIYNTTAPVHELFLTRNGAPTTLEDLILADRGIGSLPSGRHDLRFGQTTDGEIYVMTKADGWIRQLVGAAGAQQLIMSVDRGTGQITVRNATGAVVDLQSYAINSATGSLNPNNGFWNSLADQGVPGWSENSPTASHLAESTAGSPLGLANNDHRSLGRAYKPVYASFGTAGPEDLQFQYNTPGGPKTGLVEYTGIDVTNNLVLTVDPTTGYARLRNASPFNVAIDGYTINSFLGLLLPGNGDWNSFTDQGLSGWVEAGPDAVNLSELNPLNSMQLASGASFDMGRIFTPGAEPDLQFTFFLDAVSPERLGVIVYAPLGLPGDYNRDGKVGPEDYVVWRNTLGQQVDVYSDADGSGNGVVDLADYDFWRARLGKALPGSGAAVAAVPEPSAALLTILAAGLLAFRPRSW